MYLNLYIYNWSYLSEARGKYMNAKMHAYMTLNGYVIVIVFSNESYTHKHVISMWSWTKRSVRTFFGVLNQ